MVIFTYGSDRICTKNSVKDVMFLTTKENEHVQHVFCCVLCHQEFLKILTLQARRLRAMQMCIMLAILQDISSCHFHRTSRSVHWDESQHHLLIHHVQGVCTKFFWNLYPRHKQTYQLIQMISLVHQGTKNT